MTTYTLPEFCQGGPGWPLPKNLSCIQNISKQKNQIFLNIFFHFNNELQNGVGKLSGFFNPPPSPEILCPPLTLNIIKLYAYITCIIGKWYQKKSSADPSKSIILWSAVLASTYTLSRSTWLNNFFLDAEKSWTTTTISYLQNKTGDKISWGSPK